jgi:hypothetical protein
VSVCLSVCVSVRVSVCLSLGKLLPLALWYVRVCKCVCVCKCACVYTYMHACKCVCVYTYILYAHKYPPPHMTQVSSSSQYLHPIRTQVSSSSYDTSILLLTILTSYTHTNMSLCIYRCDRPPCAFKHVGGCGFETRGIYWQKARHGQKRRRRICAGRSRETHR